MRICFINLVSTPSFKPGRNPPPLSLDVFTKIIINKSVPGVYVYSVAMETGTINDCVNKKTNESEKK